MKRRFLQLSVLFAGLLALAVGDVSAQWNTVGPVAGPGFTVFCLKSRGDNLIAAGTGIAMWDGTSWTSLGPAAPTTSTGQGSIGVNAMISYNGALYAAGDIDSLGGVYIDHTIGVAKWNGTAWEKVGTSAPDLSGVRCLAVYNNDLYAGGNTGINKWDGTSWTSVASTASGAGYCLALAVYHNDLYAGGNFSSIGGHPMTEGHGFAKWDGTNWTVLPGFSDTISQLPNVNIASIAGMIVSQDELYAIGAIDWTGSTYIRGAGKWDGTQWTSANGGMTGNGSLGPNCLSTDGNNVYAVGPLQKVNTANDSIFLSTFWDGSKWNPMFGGNAPYTSFFATEYHNGYIYSAYTSLVRWEGSTTAVPALQNAPNDINVYPNPCSGSFHLSLNGMKQAAIRVVNAIGATVYNEQVSTISTDHVVDLDDVPNGLYFVTVTGNGKTVTKKILLQR